MDEFEICLLPDWEEVELDEEDKAEGAYYAAKCVDQDASVDRNGYGSYRGLHPGGD